MIYDFLKDIATNQNWGFQYSRADYQNLYDEVENERVYLFVDPIVIDSKFSVSGCETVSYSGKFMLLLSSDMDEEYKDKYDTHIKPLLTSSLQQLKDEFACSSYQINSFKATEIINLFNQNMDGVLVNYNVTYLE